MTIGGYLHARQGIVYPLLDVFVPLPDPLLQIIHLLHGYIGQETQGPPQSSNLIAQVLERDLRLRLEDQLILVVSIQLSNDRTLMKVASNQCINCLSLLLQCVFCICLHQSLTFLT